MGYGVNSYEQRKLKRLYNELGNYYYVNGVWIKDGRYTRVYGRPNGYNDYMKKYNNKRIRHYDGELLDGSYYRKVFEHWWNIY